MSNRLMPLSMALAGPVSELIGVAPTFLLAGLAPPVLAVITIAAARLRTDEIAHPLDVLPDDATPPPAEPVLLQRDLT